MLRRTTNGLGIAWGLLILLAILFPAWSRAWSVTQISLLFPVYYLALSFWLGGLRDRAREFRDARGGP